MISTQLLPVIETWPEEDQEALLEAAREIAALRTGVHKMSASEEAAAMEGLAQAARGDSVGDERIIELWKRARAVNVPVAPRAENDLAKVIDYLMPRSPGGARNVVASLRGAIHAISVHPCSGERTRRRTILVKNVPGYPYRIFYPPAMNRLRSSISAMLHDVHGPPEAALAAKF